MNQSEAKKPPLGATGTSALGAGLAVGPGVCSAASACSAGVGVVVGSGVAVAVARASLVGVASGEMKMTVAAVTTG